MHPRLHNPRPPERAMLLAAGLGTRFLPLSAEIPKPLIPLWNRPLLFHGLDLLRSWGVRHVVINLHHGADAIESALAGTDFDGLEIAFSREPQRLETGGALRRAAAFFGADPFWLMNADIAADIDPAPLIDTLHADPNALAALWLTDRAGPRTVEMSNGRIRSFRSARAGTPGTFTFCGLHLVRPEALDFIPRATFRSIIRVYEEAQRAGRTILGVAPSDGFWADLGTPEKTVAAHAAVRGAHAKHQPGKRLYDPSAERAGTDGAWVCAAPGCRIETGARVAESILLEGSIVRRGADLRHAVVGPGTEIRGPATRLVTRAETALSHGELEMIHSSGFRPDRSSVEALPPRGSARSFHRVRDGARRAMLMRWKNERDENARWTGHARFLDGLGIRVPEAFTERTDPDGGSLLMQDFGPRTLQDELCPAPTPTGLALLYRAAERIGRLHAQGPAAAREAELRLEPPFDRALYRAEHRLFLDRVLRDRMNLPQQPWLQVERELARAADALEQEPPALIHRDLQSSNILRAGREPVFIDFQGMRIGPAAYDLASLLYDPYIHLDARHRHRILRAYRRGSRCGMAVIQALPWGAVQRLCQAMGAYARLATDHGLRHFEIYLPIAAVRVATVIRKSNLPMPSLLAVLEGWIALTMKRECD